MGVNGHVLQPFPQISMLNSDIIIFAMGLLIAFGIVVMYNLAESIFNKSIKLIKEKVGGYNAMFLLPVATFVLLCINEAIKKERC